ncbi:carboxypeptidase-like regulatory domain-containing protein [Belliella pelovolcani]|uniref:CarboxypepD_reg-like domain-containing protein n=1 Tax=Belliella pelovolcani TaxID=529505 RepID=A0A1N7JIE5_9BACT|nr:carboxypeptidase-like regulatory domain-containing protein [Belliella pelovolcani]SIS49026.1 CarboxypepD_reg-like domain-containing protein [Belliella pelovolcani]
MRSFFTLLGLMLFCWGAIGQTYTFAVKRAADAAPVSYAHIQIGNSLQGVVTNVDGMGSLTIPSKYSDEEIKVSFMGYEVKTLQISQLKRDQINEVLLEENDIELSGVSVVDIGISPSDFYLKTMEMVEKTFYTKSYTGLASYSERVIEDGEPTFNYEMEILYDAQGFRRATGKNQFVNNDDVYFKKLINVDGEQKYSYAKAGELVGFDFQFGPPDQQHDAFIDEFLSKKNWFERLTLYMPEINATSNWIFEDLLEKDGEKFVKLARRGSQSEIVYLVNIDSYHVNSIQAKILKVPSTHRNVMEFYLNGELDFRIDYFKVDGLSYVKQVEIIELKRIGNSPELGTKMIKGKLVFQEHTNEKPDKKKKVGIDFIDAVVMKKGD